MKGMYFWSTAFVFLFAVSLMLKRYNPDLSITPTDDILMSLMGTAVFTFAIWWFGLFFHHDHGSLSQQ
ncbi:MAG: hypothetical protein MJZ73_06835 [Bacteroidaceae bacterium]|nr:hypothetical protein [Bacteroidaceae bacterium]